MLYDSYSTLPLRCEKQQTLGTGNSHTHTKQSCGRSLRHRVRSGAVVVVCGVAWVKLSVPYYLPTFVQTEFQPTKGHPAGLGRKCGLQISFAGDQQCWLGTNGAGAKRDPANVKCASTPTEPSPYASKEEPFSSTVLVRCSVCAWHLSLNQSELLHDVVGTHLVGRGRAVPSRCSCEI